jgi:hypothetical protein
VHCHSYWVDRNGTSKSIRPVPTRTMCASNTRCWVLRRSIVAPVVGYVVIVVEVSVGKWIAVFEVRSASWSWYSLSMGVCKPADTGYRYAAAARWTSSSS